ncbi:MAG TPA: pitrilysin family protein [Longimicrobiales bacterium]|nr:pitrilysin family protein [Longimicrobiales bacterium]
MGCRLAAACALLISIAGCSSAAGPWAQSPAPAAVPFERFVLPNGLRLIVHEDHDEPIVHVRMFYHVGEKDAGLNQTGYAHLFEHLAFSQTEHLDRSIWSFLATIGARDYDATTRYDYTHYFATVPVQALDTLFWLESERMAHLVSALTEEDLLRSRAEVFQEEERLLQLPPIRLLKETWDRTYPEGHPYLGFDIGSEDLNHATLTDARCFYARYYQPSNAVLVVAGDVDAEAVRERGEVYFGLIPPGSPRVQSRPRIGRSGAQRQRIEGVLPDDHLRLVWNTPGWGTTDADHLTLASTIIASRVRARLTVDEPAMEVDGATDMRELGGQVMLDVVAPSHTIFPAIERIIEDEIDQLATEGPSAVELDHAKAQYRRQFQEDSAEVAGVTYLLGKAELFRGDPSHLEAMLRSIEAATSEDVRRAVTMWLTDGAFILEFAPAAEQGAQSY